jgi:hypothetical protein
MRVNKRSVKHQFSLAPPKNTKMCIIYCLHLAMQNVSGVTPADPYHWLGLHPPMLLRYMLSDWL